MKNKVLFASIFMLTIFILSSCASKGNGTSHPKRKGIRTEMGNM
jgi:hypothetical protein